MILFTILILQMSCGRHYFEPSDRFGYTTGSLINYAYDPGDDTFDYCFATINDTLAGKFVFTYNRRDSLSWIDDHFNKGLFDNEAIVFGQFEKGRLDGKIYSTNRLNDTIKIYEYKNGILNGDFQNLIPMGDVYLSGTYKSGQLDGPLIHREGNGVINGMPSSFRHEWRLNYLDGKLDSVQLRFFDGVLMEKVEYENGRLTNVFLSEAGKGFVMDSIGQFYFEANERAIWNTIFARSLEIDHTFKVRGKLVGDSSFLGKVYLCDGGLCSDNIVLTRVLKTPEKTMFLDTIYTN